MKCCSPRQIRMILESIKTQNMRLRGHDSMKIKPAFTDIDKNSNSVIFAAEEMIKANPQAQGQNVTVKKAGKGRGVYVNDSAAFTQAERHAKGGTFIGEFAHLSLP